MKQKILTKNKLPEIARDIISRAISQFKNNKNTATVITLSGDLGAGKTTLTQEIAKILGIKENIISPTFVIIKSYELRNKNYNFKRLIHIDAYRLNSSKELLNLGWQEIFEDKNNLIIIEWPEQVPECVENATCRVKLSHVDDQTRELEIIL